MRTDIEDTPNVLKHLQKICLKIEDCQLKKFVLIHKNMLRCTDKDVLIISYSHTFIRVHRYIERAVCQVNHKKFSP